MTDFVLMTSFVPRSHNRSNYETIGAIVADYQPTSIKQTILTPTHGRSNGYSLGRENAFNDRRLHPGTVSH